MTRNEEVKEEVKQIIGALSTCDIVGDALKAHYAKLNSDELNRLRTCVNSEDDAIREIHDAAYCDGDGEGGFALFFDDVPVSELIYRLAELDLTGSNTYEFLKWMLESAASCIPDEEFISIDDLRSMMMNRSWSRKMQ